RKTAQYVIIRALIEGVTAASELQAGTDPITGDPVAANAPISGAALRAAIRQSGQRTDAGGNRIPVPSRFRVVVPVSTSEDVELSTALARGLATIQDALLTYNASAIRS